jgi:flagellar secretion chaperone FliS
MNHYQVHAIEGANPVDLVVALYDGIIRFLFSAKEALERKDVGGRRANVKKAMDIIVHLQAILRMDVGGRVAETLAEYYSTMFALILQASQAESPARFDHAIKCIQNVREAWKKVATDPEALEALRNRQEMSLNFVRTSSTSEPDTEISSRWMA